MRIPDITRSTWRVECSRCGAKYIQHWDEPDACPVCEDMDDEAAEDYKERAGDYEDRG